MKRSYLWAIVCLSFSAWGCSEDTPSTPTDAGSDLGSDAAAGDASQLDMSLLDAGSNDSGFVDATPIDGNLGDASLDDASLEDASLEDASTADADVDGGGPSSDCETVVSDLAGRLSIVGRACSVVVRLDYNTYTILGYQYFCGSYNSTTVAEASETAIEAGGWGGTTSLTGESPIDEFLFYQSPGDFGGASAVSADTGLLVFSGSIVWDGRGDIAYPASWRSASELGTECAGGGGLPESNIRGWDLQSGEEMDVSDYGLALAKVAQSGVPPAIWQGGYVFSTLVLLYPRTVGAFDPSSAEWIVIVNGGWLD